MFALPTFHAERNCSALLRDHDHMTNDFSLSFFFIKTDFSLLDIHRDLLFIRQKLNFHGALSPTFTH